MQLSSGRPTTRRVFLKSMAATAAGGLLAAPARAVGGGINAVQPLAVGGLTIADHVLGGVLLAGDGYDYLLFDAYQGETAGTGVIRLTDSVAWRFRVAGDQDLHDGDLDPAKLDPLGAYEVLRSTWVQELVEDDPSRAGKELHHCVLTFREASFEFVVSKFDCKLSTDSFAGLYASLTGDELPAPPTPAVKPAQPAANPVQPARTTPGVRQVNE